MLTGLGAEHLPSIETKDVRVIRHIYRPQEPGGLAGPEDVTAERVLEYTRFQDISTRRFPAEAEPYWVVFIADGQRRSRLFGSFENRGELVNERTNAVRFFDLRPSTFLESLADRLVIEWTSPRNWHRRGTSAADLPVLEIADRDKVPFPGFDRVALPYQQLQEMVSDARYADWRTALSQVQGIYLITDASNGKQYVGKADGSERIYGRWSSYARDGHGGNVGLRELAFAGTVAANATVRTNHARHFVFSILRVFGPSTSSSEVDAAESHYKRVLMTREFGLNRN
ncbi:GIY-YIG nuclease family protein [Pedococcus sp. NPDC057267]|uniref:GIY-YIG nuclease family protein n=1 Tax=Pedococcus sp. NPDC057267 TaxID=3346077 RepID=UPI003645C4DA